MPDMTTNTLEPRTRVALLDSQRRVLERIASGAPLREILESLVRLIEEQANGMRCAVLLADSAQQRLTFAAAPSIPEDYKTGIDPFLRIAPEMSSCGTAAFLRKPVYTKDTGTDALWEDCRDIAVRNGLRAIWSTPILSDDGIVLGTFAMYYGEPRLPSPEHIQLIDMAVQMARVAIEAKRGQDALRRSEAFLAEAQRFGQLIAGVARGDPLKDSAGDDVVTAVRAVAARSGHHSEGVAKGVNPADRGLAGADQAIESLTAKERAILRLITEGKSNAEVGAELHLSPRTVETYRHRLMQKLNITNLPTLVKFAIRHGITTLD